MSSISRTSMPVAPLLNGPLPDNPEATPLPRTVTSHSLKLATRLFSLDYTWSQEELPPEATAPAPVSRSGSARSAGPYDPPQPFSEVLKRHQLAGLLAPVVSRPPEHSTLASTQPVASGPAQPGLAARAYNACAAGVNLPDTCRQA